MDVWGTDLRMRLPSANVDAMRREIGLAAQEFMQKATVFRTWLTAQIDSSDPVFDFANVEVVANQTGLDWGGLRGLYLHKAALEDGTEIKLLPCSPRATWTLPTGRPTKAFVREVPGFVELYPTPTEDMAGQWVMLLASLVLKQPVSAVPSELADWNYDTLLDGATARMMAHPKRPYSDAQLAQYYLRRFRNGMRTAVNEAKARWSEAEYPISLRSDWACKR
jgi:hypothetical protein